MVVIEIIKKNYDHGKQQSVCTLNIKHKKYYKITYYNVKKMLKYKDI